MSHNTESRRLSTIDRAVTILETIQDNNGLRVSELAKELDTAESTVHGYLSTLERNEFLIKENGEYNIGIRFLQIGGYASLRKDGYEFAKEKVKELAQETGERAQFIVEEHGIGTYLHTETGNSAVQIDARIGKTSRLHASAAGKAILAELSPDRVGQIIESRGLPEETEHTITDREVLYDELEKIRNRGFSLNREESVIGLRAVGVAVSGPNDNVLGALSVSAPSNRLQDERFMEELPQNLLGAANEMELKIAYPS